MVIISIIITILVFSLLIIIHELGHFAAAKWSGVQVNEFWLGMGPTLLKKEYKGTVYMLKALPFGGAVVMEGEDSQSISENSYGSAKRINRAIIIVAGAFMNFVLGYFILFVISFQIQVGTTELNGFADGFAYSGENGFMLGDEILQIDETIVKDNGDVSSALTSNETERYYIKLSRNGSVVELNDFEFKPATFIDNGVEVYRYGLNFSVKTMSLLEKIEFTAETGTMYMKLVWWGVQELFSGNVSVDEMAGPVGMTVMIGEAAETSMTSMWNFVAFISINLGVMNLLPLPALDGGRLFLIGVEAIRRKPLNPKIEGYVHGAGLAVLLTFMVYVTFNDIFVKILG